jgi:hypothetical protein
LRMARPGLEPVEGRDIEAPAIVSEIDFWTALHEAGHVVLGLDTDGEDGAPIFENEIAVWRWAFDEAPVLPSGHASLLIDTLRHSYANDPGCISRPAAVVMVSIASGALATLGMALRRAIALVARGRVDCGVGDRCPAPRAPGGRPPACDAGVSHADFDDR